VPCQRSVGDEILGACGWTGEMQRLYSGWEWDTRILESGKWGDVVRKVRFVRMTFEYLIIGDID
jgi:hypothetical protein